ncbi:hypothetical protein K501DRAFT_92470, partial [Backusella circina FSU 941]
MVNGHRSPNRHLTVNVFIQLLEKIKQKRNQVLKFDIREEHPHKRPKKKTPIFKKKSLTFFFCIKIISITIAVYRL